MNLNSKPAILLIFLVFTFSVFSGFRFLQGDTSLTHNLEILAKKWPHVELLLDPGASHFAVPQWKKAYLDLQATKMSRVQTTKLLPLLIRELEKYPAAVINNHLDAVALVDTLKLSGVYQNSANVHKRIYLTSSVFADNAALGQLIHQEISAVLLRQIDFPLMQWGRHMPSYQKQPISIASFLEKEMHVDGCEPGMAIQEKLRLVGLNKQVVENDIITLSGQLFVAPNTLKAKATNSAVLGSKYEMLIQFYTKLAPAYSWQF